MEKLGKSEGTRAKVGMHGSEAHPTDPGALLDQCYLQAEERIKTVGWGPDIHVFLQGMAVAHVSAAGTGSAVLGTGT